MSTHARRGRENGVADAVVMVQDWASPQVMPWMVATSFRRQTLPCWMVDLGSTKIR